MVPDKKLHLDVMPKKCHANPSDSLNISLSHKFVPDCGIREKVRGSLKSSLSENLEYLVPIHPVDVQLFNK